MCIENSIEYELELMLWRKHLLFIINIFTLDYEVFEVLLVTRELPNNHILTKINSQ